MCKWPSYYSKSGISEDTETRVHLCPDTTHGTNRSHRHPDREPSSLEVASAVITSGADWESPDSESSHSRIPCPIVSCPFHWLQSCSQRGSRLLRTCTGLSCSSGQRVTEQIFMALWEMSNTEHLSQGNPLQIAKPPCYSSHHCTIPPNKKMQHCKALNTQRPNYRVP